MRIPFNSVATTTSLCLLFAETSFAQQQHFLNSYNNRSMYEQNGAMPCTYPCPEQMPSAWTTSQNGLNLISSFEGWSSTCYQDSYGIWTIGYGHACQSDSDNLPSFGVTCTAGSCSGSLTAEQGLQVLHQDMAEFESCVKSYVTVPLTNNQFDALVSFAYNTGCGALQSSTLL